MPDMRLTAASSRTVDSENRCTYNTGNRVKCRGEMLIIPEPVKLSCYVKNSDTGMMKIYWIKPNKYKNETSNIPMSG